MFQRWLRPIRRIEDLQPRPEDPLGHRRMERRFPQVQPARGRPRPQEDLHPQRDPVLEAIQLRRIGSGLGISGGQRRRQA